jgi:transposase
MAAAPAWHDGVGIPVRQVPLVMAAWTGVQLTQGALTPEAWRRAAGVVGTAYEPRRATVPETPGVYPDDTGWRVGGEPAHLMAFETEGATVSQIRPRHRHEEVPEVIPADYGGGMVTDRGRRSEAQAFDRVAQHKCLAPILRSLSDVMERKRGRARAFGTQLKTVLQDALALWHRHRDSPVADFKVEAAVLQTERTYQLRDRRLNDRDHQRLLNELGWHQDRGNVLRFWVDPRIEPTNHRAERAWRPAVIARKVSHGSKNDAGAHAFAAFTRVVRTLATHRVDSLVENLSHLFRGPGVHVTSP